MKTLALLMMTSFAHADLGVLSLHDVVAAQQNQDGTYSVVCANGNRETVSAADVSAGNVCPNQSRSTPTGILSMIQRAHGDFDVICRDLSRAQASVDQILNGEVCADSRPSVIIEDGVYSAPGSSDCTIKAVYEGQRLARLKASFPGTSADLTCVDAVCTGTFSGYPQNYRFEILSPTSFDFSYDGGSGQRVFTKN